MVNTDYTFSAYSTLFNAVDNSIFIRDRLANQVAYINSSNNNKLTINNEDRLKDILFKEIERAYNNRINHYDLNLRRLNDTDKNNLEIQKFSLSETIKNIKSKSGSYRVYPKVFSCNKCGNYKVYQKSNFDQFNPICNCGGKFTQVSILGFCPECGKIESISRACPKCNTLNDLELVTYGKESPKYWDFKCRNCGNIYDFSPPLCNHSQIGFEEPLSNRDPKRYKFVNVRRGGLYKSCVKTIVDVPKNEDVENDSEYIDEIIICDYFERWEGLNLKEGDEVKHIKSRLKKAKSSPPGSQSRELEILDGTPESVFELADKAVARMEEIRNEFNDVSLSSITDYLMLKSNILSDSEDEDDVLNNHSLNESYKELYGISEGEYLKFLKKFGIEDITYIQSMQLVSSAYGYIRGINKFYEDDFVPHFEPYRPYDFKKKELNIKGLKAYAYPYETEGIMFDLDKIKIANWLISNFNSSSPEITSEKEARRYLFQLKEEGEEYVALKKLIHSFSHILIKRSSLYTGLNEDSCSELLFPKNGAFLIYSTSNVNIGGFLYVFENSILDWFESIEFDIKECIFDPNCLDEEGACFSCMHLPEFVCTEFNKNLDRDVFLGNVRFKKGFWEID